MPRRAHVTIAAATAVGLIAASVVTATALSASASSPAVAPGTSQAVHDTSGSAPELTFTVDGPAVVSAGEEARFTTSWSDGQGELLGAIEDWGDLGVGSIAPPACEDPSATPVVGASTGGDHLTHTWDTPGTYRVTLGVTTGGCAIAEQTESVTFDVTVA